MAIFNLTLRKPGQRLSRDMKKLKAPKNVNELTPISGTGGTYDAKGV